MKGAAKKMSRFLGGTRSGNSGCVGVSADTLCWPSDYRHRCLQITPLINCINIAKKGEKCKLAWNSGLLACLLFLGCDALKIDVPQTFDFLFNLVEVLIKRSH